MADLLAYRESLTAALVAAHPTLREVTIPAKVVAQTVGQGPVGAMRTYDHTAIYGVEWARPWKIAPRFGLPEDRHRPVPVLELHAGAWTAPPGLEPSRRYPWLVAGGLLGMASRAKYPFWVRTGLLLAETKRPGASTTVGKTGLGRPMVAAASYPRTESFLRSPEFKATLDRWETLVGPPKLLDAGVAPILAAEVPNISLAIEVKPTTPPSRYVDLLGEFAVLVEGLERSFDAPTAREVPIPTETRELVPGVPSPEPTRLFTCPKCGRMERLRYLSKGVGVHVQAISGDCEAPLFQESVEWSGGKGAAPLPPG